MGKNIKNAISLYINQLMCMVAGRWTIFLSMGCVMLLTLLRYDVDWSDNENIKGWGIILLGIVAIGCTIRKEGKIKWTSLEALVALNFLYFIMNIAFLSNYPIAHHMIIVAECVMMYVFIRVITAEEKGIDKIIVYTMAIAGVYESIFGILQLTGMLEANSIREKMTGSFLNSGPMGIYIAVMLSACTDYYFQKRDKIIGGCIIFMLIVMPATMSRTAMLAYCIVIILQFRTFILKHWKISLVAIAVTITILYFFKQGSADSRIFMNIVALNEWKEKPLWGCGVGGYVHTLANGQMKYFAMHPDSMFIDSVGSTDMAFNEYMKVLVEQGIVGLILLTCTLGLTVYRLLRKHSPLAYSMIAICVVALFSYPFHLHQFLLISTLLTALATGKEVAEDRACAFRKFLTAGFLALCLVFMGVLQHESHRRTKISQEAHCFSFMNNAAFIDDFYELLPTMTDNRQYLFSFGKTLREAGRFNDSNAILRLGTKLDTDPMTYVLMGRNYEDMNLPKEADSLYRQAFLLQPNRIYPLYRQMKLYMKTGDNRAMRDKAKEIVVIKPKVMSPVVEKMKNEAKKIAK
ncbi:O-antigen ligase family protein [Segatella paludivivens]|uniref:O-antigen ligase family protein n=1 Tax=Segatella paludivivens TaxID=185294 RepID=UPI0003797A55|nr:O-antigen ligase family protein [Segatella paludivivens]